MVDQTADATVTTPAAKPGAGPAVESSDAVPAYLYWPAQARFWLVAAGGLLIDLLSKYWAFYTLGQGPGSRRVVIPYLLEFQTMFNPGALFGIGAGQTTLFLGASVLALGLVIWIFARSEGHRWVMHVALAAILAGALGNMYDRLFVKLHPQQTGNGGVVYLEEVGASDGVIHMREYPPGGPHSVDVSFAIEREQLGEPVGHVRDFLKIPTKLPDWLATTVGAQPGQDLWPWIFNVADVLLVTGVGVLAVLLWREGKPVQAADGAAGGGS